MKITNRRAYVKCPYHKDSNPSLVITLEGPHTGKWYCFSCGKAGVLTKDKLEKLLKRKPKRTRPTPIDLIALNSMYINQCNKVPFVGICNKIYQDLELGWDGEAWTFPMRDYKGEITGIHRRFPDGFKCCVGGSSRGLFVPKSLINPHFPRFIYITEGVSDLCFLLNQGDYGIGRMDCNMIEEVVQWIDNNYTSGYIVVADNDGPGIKGGAKLAKELNCKMWVPTKGKDLREHLTKGGHI